MTDLDALRALVAKAVHALQSQPIRTHWDGCESHHPHCMVAKLIDALPALLDRLEQAEAECEKLRTNAERYRWLRNADNWTEEGPMPCVATFDSTIYGDALDAAIDAALGER